MAVNAPIGASWTAPRPSNGSQQPTAHPTEGRTERIASWLVMYLVALLTRLAIGESAWELGMARVVCAAGTCSRRPSQRPRLGQSSRLALTSLQMRLSGLSSYMNASRARSSSANISGHVSISQFGGSSANAILGTSVPRTRAGVPPRASTHC